MKQRFGDRFPAADRGGTTVALAVMRSRPKRKEVRPGGRDGEGVCNAHESPEGFSTRRLDFMKWHSFSKRALVIAVVLLGLALPAFGQLQSGNIYGTVAGTDGVPLPGVTVTLTAKAGSAGTQTQ